MAAGSLRTRFRVEAPTKATDATGQRGLSWPALTDPPLCHMWGQLEFVAGTEAQPHNKTQATRTWKVTVRKDPVSQLIKPSFRLVQTSGEARTLNIGSVGPDPDHLGYLLLTCTEQVATP